MYLDKKMLDAFQYIYIYTLLYNYISKKKTIDMYIYIYL